MLGPREIVQQLKTPAILPGDPSIVPRTQARWLTTAHDSVLAHLTHSSGFCRDFHVHVHIPRQGHIQIYINKN